MNKLVDKIEIKRVQTQNNALIRQKRNKDKRNHKRNQIGEIDSYYSNKNLKLSSREKTRQKIRRKK